MNVMDSDDLLRAQRAHLRQEHAALDAEIAAIEARPLPDQIAIRRLKKRKLWLKDEIARIEDGLYPDIIA